MIYVALLRGINVGGTNKVDMKMLKTTFWSLGFTHVMTYINSGNIIFENSTKGQGELVTRIEEAIKRDFQLDIKVLVRSFENIELICQTLPVTWVKNEQMRTEVLFLWEKFDTREVLGQLKITSVDNVLYLPGTVLWHVEAKNYSKSGMQKLIGTALYKHMTIRNVNTVRKLYQLMSTIKG
jgi:uncharacterized protein (DUF1697 family)